MTTEEVQKDGGSDPRAKLPWPSAARQDDGAATLDRSAAQDGKRGLCQPTGATFRANTGSEQAHARKTCGIHWICRLILFAVDIFQTLAMRDSFGPTDARLMSIHPFAG